MCVKTRTGMPRGTPDDSNTLPKCTDSAIVRFITNWLRENGCTEYFFDEV